MLYLLSVGFNYVLTMCMRPREKKCFISSCCFSVVIQNCIICFLCIYICEHNIVTTHLQGGVQRGEKETDRETFSQTADMEWDWDKEGKQRGVVCCFSGNFCFLVGVVWLSWWEQLPGWGQPEACLGNRPFIGFLIGGSAVKWLSYWPVFLAAFPPMKCTQESGGCGPKVTETQESFQ